MSFRLSKDPRFNDEIGQMTGCQAKSLLCHPIKNADDEIVGVAQLLNKSSGDGAFSQDDVKVNNSNNNKNDNNNNNTRSVYDETMQTNVNEYRHHHHNLLLLSP